MKEIFVALCDLLYVFKEWVLYQSPPGGELKTLGQKEAKMTW